VLTWPNIHLYINHFPVILSVLGLGAAIAALIFRRRGLWLYAMGTLALAGAVVFPVRFSGDQADHALRDPWYIKQGAIEAHDDASLWALYCLLIVGAVSAYGLWRAWKGPQEEIPAWLRAAVLIGAIFAASIVARVAYLGGRIIHEAPVLMLPNPPANLPPGIAAPPAPPEN